MSDTPQSAIRLWSEMIKFPHSIFALPFALTATFLAGRNLADGHPSVLQLVLIVVCMVSARSVAMTFNRIIDAQIDARNPRTANRAIPAGKLTVLQAWVFLAVATLTFAAGCFSFYFLPPRNPWPMLLGAPVLAVLCSYSLAKRFTSLAHFILGGAIALSPVAAWIAIHPASLGWVAVLLAMAVALWIGGFDIIYACQDVDVDRRDGLFSLPARLGIARALMIGRAAHAGVVILLIAVGYLAGLGWIYAIGVTLVAVLLLVENLAVKPDDLSHVNVAFFTINGIVSIVMAACAITDILLAP